MCPTVHERHVFLDSFVKIDDELSWRTTAELPVLLTCLTYVMQSATCPIRKETLLVREHDEIGSVYSPTRVGDGAGAGARPESRLLQVVPH